jgi:plasmid stabilization system protein ParE
MKQIDLRPEARAEIRDATDWYEKQSPGLGREFVNAVHQALAVVAQYPHAF